MSIMNIQEKIWRNSFEIAKILNAKPYSIDGEFVINLQMYDNYASKSIQMEVVLTDDGEFESLQLKFDERIEVLDEVRAYFEEQIKQIIL